MSTAKNKKTNNIDPTVEFPLVEKMLYQLAWQYSKSYPISFEDAKGEAYMGFMKACNNYKPGRGTKFSSWCYFVTWGYLKSYTMTQSKNAKRYQFVEVNDELLGAAPPVKCESLELIDDLSEDAKQIVGLLLETPREILGRTPLTAKELAARVRRFLVKQGKRKCDVDLAYNELRTRFQQNWAV